MHKIKEMLMKELKEYEKKEKLSAGDLETIHKLTDTVKNIDKIEMLEGGEGYSEDGMSYDGSSYDDGSSYARRRDSMGRYSRDGGKEDMSEKLREMMGDAKNEKEREAIRRCMSELERV